MLWNKEIAAKGFEISDADNSLVLEDVKKQIIRQLLQDSIGIVPLSVLSVSYLFV